MTYLAVGLLLAAGGLVLGLAELFAPCVNALDPAIRDVPACQETRTLALVGFVGAVLGVVLLFAGRSKRLETAPYLHPARREEPGRDPTGFAENLGSALGPRSCPECGGRYPASMTFCPRDGAILENPLGARDVAPP